MQSVAIHRDYIAGRQFHDEQVHGPFRRWVHTHSFIDDGPNASWLIDRVEYALPFGPLAELLAGWFVRRKLNRMFAWRHEVTVRAVLNTSHAG